MSEPQSLISLKAALQEKRAPQYRRIVRWLWRLIYAGLIGAVAFFIGINFMAIPSFRELEDPNSALASEVMSAEGPGQVVLGRYFIENRVKVDYEDLGPHLVNALVSTEDERYWQHCGVDPWAILRVVGRTIILQDRSAGGGSTITQQLAKMLYSSRDFKGMTTVEKLGTLIYRKLREWITAVKLERSYTKEEIIAMYLNQVNFVNNTYGIRSASEVYFSREPEQLKTEEAATLIGMLQNPSLYNPLRFPDKCMRRRMIVLYQMHRNGHLTEAQYDSLKVLNLDMSRFKRVTFTDDKAPYLCAELKKDLAAILSQPEHYRPDGNRYDIYKDGLRIVTTIDPVYQQYAEDAMVEHMKKIQARFFAVWRGRDPWTYKTAETSSEEVQQRKEALMRTIREGDRYQAMRPKYLGAVGDRIEERFEVELRDADILRMLDEDKKSGAISQMVARKWVTPQQAADYRRIMASSEWPEIKKQWTALQAAILKQYQTKGDKKVKVFAWDADFEKDTLLSPYDSLKYSRMFLQTGILAVDPLSNEVKAWVGGINFKYFQFDHVRTQRQVGSTFKPFVYATAISQQGISPCLPVYDQPVTIPARYQNFTNVTDWTPKDAAGYYSNNLMTLKDGLKNSVNSISAYLMKQMGDTELVRGLVNNMGIDSAARRPDGEYRIPKQPSICLGVADLTVLEMTGAYATFAKNGTYGRPYVIKRIEDKNGRVIYTAPIEERVALPPNANYVMVDMLKYNVRGAPGINTLKSEVGGKTGTTNDYSDGWFMGVTPRLVVGTWVGGEDRWIRFLGLGDGQGAKMARPIFASFIQRLEKDKNSGYDANARFKRPAGDLGIEINCAAYRDSLPPTDEEFAPDIYNDEIPAGSGEGEAPPVKPADGKTPPARKPDPDNFGDED